MGPTSSISTTVTARSDDGNHSGRSVDRGPAAAFLDYDNDGGLDLYVSCYGQWSFETNTRSVAMRPKICGCTVHPP